MKANTRLHFCFSESSNEFTKIFAILFVKSIFLNYNLHTIHHLLYLYNSVIFGIFRVV